MTGGEIIFVLSVAAFVVIFLLMFWKEIYQMIDHEKFYRVTIFYNDGRVRQFWHYIKGDVITHEGKEYRIVPTANLFKGSKYYQYVDGEADPLVLEKNIDARLDMDYLQTKIKYAKLFEEDETWWEKLLKTAIPFVLGLVIGAMGAYIQLQQAAQATGGA